MPPQVQTGATWYSQGFGSTLQASLHQPMPSLVAMPLRAGQVPSAILAAGTYSAALLSEHGHVLDQLTLPVRWLPFPGVLTSEHMTAARLAAGMPTGCLPGKRGGSCSWLTQQLTVCGSSRLQAT